MTELSELCILKVSCKIISLLTLSLLAAFIDVTFLAASTDATFIC